MPSLPTSPALADDTSELVVRTLRIDEPVDLLGHVPEHLSAAWLRHGQGLVAVGTAWSVQTAGPHRFAAASAAFQHLAQRCRIDDEVRTRASGLIALGSFSYADGSARPSTLMVPQAALGVEEGEAFLTVVGTGVEPEVPASWRDLFPHPRTPDPGELDIDPRTPQSSTRPWCGTRSVRSRTARRRRWCSPS
ncbi:hypothetical protein [Brachybacterium epidermidis]|uniref:hypothetical protein n=1 Tax=Brachybacterium epidermidis TaxID=2781983 RepID=UPI001D1361E5|nr:hypothetical protein [Brachybacterium epidermidis]